jgi:hypothetical protein
MTATSTSIVFIVLFSSWPAAHDNTLFSAIRHAAPQARPPPPYCSSWKTSSISASVTIHPSQHLVLPGFCGLDVDPRHGRLEAQLDIAAQAERERFFRVTDFPLMLAITPTM